MSSGSTVPLESALVRVWRGNTPIGAGFLAGPDHILTAAHVVADALDLATDQIPPAGAQVTIDFPLLAGSHQLTAGIVAWRGPGPGDGPDVAGLRLLEAPPDGARPATLGRRRGRMGAPLVMVGFPRGLELGTWVYGRQGGPVATGWVEIESAPDRPMTLARGFSGTPVWSSEADAVLGMVVYKVSGASQKIGLMVPVEALLAAWPDLAEEIEDRVPFRALRAFGEQDSDLYFGREAMADQIAERIRGEVPVIGVIGGSGAGKSSLWHAGVVPRLAAEGGSLVATFRPSDASTPLNALALALDAVLEPDRGVAARLDAVSALARRLDQGELPEAVTAILASRGAERLVIAVDQFEEVFGAPAADRAAFVRALQPGLGPPSRMSLLINLRDTFLGPVLEDRALTELSRRWVPVTVGDMSDADLRRVMTGPLERPGTVDFADGLVERILQDLRRTPNPLPLLEFTLAELWERRTDGWLTHEAYEAMGGVSKALAEYAGRVWAGLDTETRATAERLLVQLARPLAGDDLTVRRTVLRNECDDAQWAVAQRLATTRLLVLHEVSSGSAGESQTPGVELAHDSLLDHWERLRALTTGFREFRIWQDGLQQRIDKWSSSGSARSRLIAGTDLKDARRWASTHPEHLSAQQRAYIAASAARRRRRIAGVAAGLVVALVVTRVVYENRSRQVARSLAHGMAAGAEQLAGSDRYSALQLAMRADRTDSSVGIKAELVGRDDLADKLLPFMDFVHDPTSSGSSSSPSSDSPTAGAGNVLTESRGDAQLNIGALAQEVSADGRTLVSTDAAYHTVVWKVSGQQVLADSLSGLYGPTDGSEAPVISRSGHYVAFVQTVYPDHGMPKANGPVDKQGLPIPDPHQYHTCVPANMGSLVRCLVVYDTVQRRVVFADQVPQVSMIGRNFTVTIDPTDQVVGLNVADGVMPPAMLRNTLYLYDLHSGRLLRQVRLPWQSLVVQLGLGPGATTATVSEALLDDVNHRADLSLSFVDLASGSGARTEMVDDPKSLIGVSTSLDGSTVAAMLQDAADSGAQLVSWSTATGKMTKRITGLTAAEKAGTLALDATGATAWISYLRPDALTVQATDIREVGPALSSAQTQVSVWSLSSGSKTGPYPEVLGWAAPLGSGLDSPLAFVDGSLLSLVLTHPRGATPLSRLDDSADSTAPTPTLASLCSLLGEPNQDLLARKSVPSGAYRGSLCP